MTMTLIQHSELSGGAAASIEFTSIPQIYTDLYLVVSARSTRTDQGPRNTLSVQFNTITTNYSYRRLYGIPGLATGTDTGSGSDAFLLGYQTSNASTSNTFGNGSLYILNYTSSENKSGIANSVGESNETSTGLSSSTSLWSNTAAITSLKIQDPGFNLMQYSSATLYGITKGTSGVVVS